MKRIIHSVVITFYALLFAGCFSGQLDTPAWVERFTDPEVVQQVEQGTYVSPSTEDAQLDAVGQDTGEDVETPDAVEPPEDTGPIADVTEPPEDIVSGEASCFELELCAQACFASSGGASTDAASCAANCKAEGSLDAQAKFESLMSCWLQSSGNDLLSLADCHAERAACWYDETVGQPEPLCDTAMDMVAQCLSDASVPLVAMNLSLQSNANALACFHDVGKVAGPGSRVAFLDGLGCLLGGSCFQAFLQGGDTEQCAECLCAGELGVDCPPIEEVCGEGACGVLDHGCGESFDCGGCGEGKTCVEGACVLDGACSQDVLILTNETEDLAGEIASVLGCEHLDAITIESTELFTPELNILSLPNLKSADSVSITGCSGLLGFNFPSIEFIDVVAIQENDDFQRLGVPPRTLQTAVVISDNPDLCNQVVTDWIDAFEVGPSEVPATGGNDGLCCGDGVIDSTEACDTNIALPEGQSCEPGTCALECGEVSIELDNATAVEVFNVLEPLKRCRTLGSLIIDNSDIANIPTMSELSVINGELRISNNGTLTELVQLPVLGEINGSLQLQNTALQSLILPMLNHVGGTLIIEASPLTVLALDQLETIGHLEVTQLEVLDTLALPGLEAAGSILVDTMSGLSEVQFPALSEVTQSFVVKNNSALLGLTLPELETIGTSLELVGNPALLAVTATALNFVNQGFRFQGSGNLQGVELGMLQIGLDSSCDAEVCGLVIEDIGFADGEPTEAQVFLPFLAATTSLDLITTELTTLPFSNGTLGAVSGDVNIADNPHLDTLPSMTPGGSIEGDIAITDNASLCEQTINSWLADVATSAAVEVEISNNASGAECELCGEAPCAAGEVCIDDTCVSAGECGSLSAAVYSVDDLLAIEDCSTLQSLTITINDLDELPSLPNLVEVTGTLLINGGSYSNISSFPNLEVVAELVVQSLTEAELVEFPALVEVEGQLKIATSATLLEIRLPVLSEVGQAMRLVSLPGLGKVEVPALQTVGQVLEVNSTGLSVLFEPGGDFTVSTIAIHDNPYMHPLEARLWADHKTVLQRQPNDTSSLNFQGLDGSPSSCGVGCKGGKTCFLGQCLTGQDCSDVDLVLTSNGEEQDYLDCAVLGSLKLSGFGDVNAPQFPNLKGVLRDLCIEGSAEFTDQDNAGVPLYIDGLSEVEWIGGTFYVGPGDVDADVQTLVNLENLERVGFLTPGNDTQALFERIIPADLSSPINLPSLEAVSGNLDLTGLPTQSTLSFPSLRYVTDIFVLADLPLTSLEDVGSSDFTTELGDILFANLPMLCLSELDRWVHRGSIRLLGVFNDVLTGTFNVGVDPICLSSCSGVICEAHQSCDPVNQKCVDGYDCSGEAIVANGQALFSEAGLSVSDGQVPYDGAGVSWEAVSWPDAFAPYQNCAVVNHIVTYLYPLSVLSPLPRLVRSGYIRMYKSPWRDELAPGGDKVLNHFPSLRSVMLSGALPDMPPLPNIGAGQGIDIWGSDVVAIDLPALEYVPDLLWFDELLDLAEIKLESLVTVAGNLLITTQPSLKTLSMPNLESVSWPGIWFGVDQFQFEGFRLSGTGLETLPEFNGVPTLGDIVVTWNPYLCNEVITAWTMSEAINFSPPDQLYGYNNGLEVDCIETCESTTDCDSDSACIDGVCVSLDCSQGQACPDSYLCSDGTCLQAFLVCGENQPPCPAGSICAGGSCYVGEDCSGEYVVMPMNYGGNPDSVELSYKDVDNAVAAFLEPYLGCAVLGGLEIDGNYASELPIFEHLREIGSLRLRFMYDLKELKSFPKLLEVHNFLSLEEFHPPAEGTNPQGPGEVSFPELLRVGMQSCGGLDISNLQYTSHIDLRNLVHVCGAFELSILSLVSPTTFDFSKLERVDGLVTLEQVDVVDLSLLSGLTSVYGLTVKNMEALNTWNLNDELNIISDPSGTLYPTVIVQNAPNLCLSDVDLWFNMLPTNSADLVVMNLKDCTGWGGGGN